MRLKLPVNPNAAALITAMLRYVFQAAPRPVPAQELANLSNLPREDVATCVVFLCSMGALQEAVSAEEPGVAFTLTPAGEQVARNPARLEQFAAAAAADLPLMDGGGNPVQRRHVREVMLTRPRPILMRVLLAANIAVFVWGLVLATQQKVASEFLNPVAVVGGGRINVAVADILMETGALQYGDIAAGQWWRLLSCCFVHIGLLHLAMNMYAFFVLGRDVEWLWGRVRFAIIYLLAGFGGSCVAMVAAPGLLAGASGAICGLFGAEAAWLLLNRRYLPPRAVRAQMRGMVINGILLLLISLAPGVSGLGHLGGAVAGALAGVLLHFHLLGKRLVQVACIIGLLAVPALSWFVLQTYGGSATVGEKRSRRTPAQEQADMAAMRSRQDTVDARARRFTRNQLRPLLEQPPAQRDAAGVKTALIEIAQQRELLNIVAHELERIGPFTSELLEAERQAAADYFDLRERLLSEITDCLRNGEAWDESREVEVAKAQRRWLDAEEESKARR